MFDCSSCAKQFKSKSSLKKHATRFHGKSRNSCQYCGKKTGRKALSIHLNVNRCEELIRAIANQEDDLSRNREPIKETDLPPCFVLLKRLSEIEKVAAAGRDTCNNEHHNTKDNAGLTLPNIEIISVKSENDSKRLQIKQPQNKVTNHEEEVGPLKTPKTSTIEIQRVESIPADSRPVSKKQIDYQETRQRQSGRDIEKRVPRSFYYHALQLVNQMQPSTPLAIQSPREDNVDHAVLDLLQQRATNSKDEDRMFLLSILSDFKRVPSQKKVRVKKKIVEAIAEAFE